MALSRPLPWILAAGALLGACDPGPEPPRRSGQEGMLAALAEVGARAREENPWFGDRKVRAERARLADLPADAADLGAFRIYRELAAEELRLGNVEPAIEYAQRARDLAFSLAGEVTEEQRIEALFQLGVTHMRRGEIDNCCSSEDPEACILPIAGGGLHVQLEGSRNAIEHLEEVLRLTSGEHTLARWILNIAYMTLDEYPHEVPAEFLLPQEAYESSTSFPRFANVAPSLGLNIDNEAGGIIVDDFDNDDLLDIVTGCWRVGCELRYFRNEGDGTFTDHSESAFGGISAGLNMVQADYDNDGFTDVLVLRGAWMAMLGKVPNSLLKNNGDGTFTDVTFECGLGDVAYPTQAAGWADFDNDGDLDIYIGNEHVDRLEAMPAQLFRNEGDGTFVDVAKAAGVENFGYAKGVSWGDFDNDGWIDIYVSNRFEANRLYRNNGDGTFVDIAEASGVERPVNGFPTWFWDYNNDGNLDIYASSRVGQRRGIESFVQSFLGSDAFESDLSRLYRGDGAGGFEDVTVASGLTRLGIPMGANYGDIDGDGYLDFYLGTGFAPYEALVPNLMYRNTGGSGFEDITFAGGFGLLQKGHGIAFADLDNDGDNDVYAQTGGMFPGDGFADAVFENPGFGNRWIMLHLVGVGSNRSAIGARVRVEIIEDGRPRSIQRQISTGGSFGSNSLRQSLGLGQATSIELLEVHWPATSMTQRFYSVPLDQALRITEGVDQLQTYSPKTF